MIAVDTADQAVTWGRSRAEGLTVLSIGSRDQRVLGRAGDDVRIDWGYFRLAVPDDASALTAMSRDSVRQFIEHGDLPGSDDLDMPLQPREGAAHAAVELKLGSVGEQPVSRHVLLAYTENYAIEYLQRKL